MKVIGLTGNIATGKTAVLGMLKQLGAHVVDADAVVHRLLQRGGEVYWLVVGAFGRGILKPDGDIDRGKLAAVVFADGGALARLEAILYPHVDAEVGAWLENLRSAAASKTPEDSQVAVIDAVKLLESPLAARCDQVWVVTARPEQQLERMTARRGMSEVAARARLEAQPSLAAHLARADVVIDNSGTLDETRVQVQAAWQKLVGACRERN